MAELLKLSDGQVGILLAWIGRETSVNLHWKWEKGEQRVSCFLNDKCCHVLDLQSS